MVMVYICKATIKRIVMDLEYPSLARKTVEKIPDRSRQNPVIPVDLASVERSTFLKKQRKFFHLSYLLRVLIGRAMKDLSKVNEALAKFESNGQTNEWTEISIL